MRNFIVGDIHGRLDKLNNLLKEINFNKDADVIYFLGDYIDRGDNSKGVLDKIIELCNHGCAKCILGNHDYNLIQATNHKRKTLSNLLFDQYVKYEGSETWNSYNQNNEELYKHVSFLSELPLRRIVTNKYGTIFHLVHAGFNPNKSINHQSLDDLIWDRTLAEMTYYQKSVNIQGIPNDSYIVMGHSYFSETPILFQNKILLDTGCGYKNGLLTAFDIDTMEWISV